MKMRKSKLTAVLCAVLLTLGLMAGCSGGSRSSSSSVPESSAGSEAPPMVEAPGSQPESQEPEEPAEPKAQVRVGTLKGPTGMGMVGLMDANAQGIAANAYTFDIAGAPEDMTAKVLSGQVDIAAVPTNMASVLYNKTEGKVSIIAVNTLGVLYILDTEGQVATMADLKGKTLYASGQGAAPEYVLNHLLQTNGLTPGTDITIEYQAEHAQLATMMISGTATLAMLPQPFVTTVAAQNENAKVVLDLTAEWSKTSSDASLAMGCIVVRNAFLEENKDAVDKFLSEYEESVNLVNRDIEDAAALMEQYDIIAASVAEKAIPSCNIVYIGGDEMQPYVSGFLQVLFDANPQAVGGKLPDDAFYYKG